MNRRLEQLWQSMQHARRARVEAEEVAELVGRRLSTLDPQGKEAFDAWSAALRAMAPLRLATDQARAQAQVAGASVVEQLLVWFAADEAEHRAALREARLKVQLERHAVRRAQQLEHQAAARLKVVRLRRAELEAEAAYDRAGRGLGADPP